MKPFIFTVFKLFSFFSRRGILAFTPWSCSWTRPELFNAFSSWHLRNYSRYGLDKSFSCRAQPWHFVCVDLVLSGQLVFVLFFFFFFPLLFVKAANFLLDSAPFSLLHCFVISCSALYGVGCESSIFGLWHMECIAFLVLLCLLFLCPNYRQVTAKSLDSDETGRFSGVDPKTKAFIISLTSFQQGTLA